MTTILRDTAYYQRHTGQHLVQMTAVWSHLRSTGLSESYVAPAGSNYPGVKSFRELQRALCPRLFRGLRSVVLGCVSAAFFRTSIIDVSKGKVNFSPVNKLAHSSLDEVFC